MSAPVDSAPRPAVDDPAEDLTTAPRLGWLRECGIVLGFYYGYQTIRSLADHGGVTARAYANARRLVDLERAVGLFHEQVIQQAFIGAGWFIRLMNIYYGTLHFAVTVGVLVWLYVRHADVYRRMRNLLGLTTALALIGYWAFPLAPPRLYKCNENIPVPGPDGYTIGKCFIDTLDRMGGLWSYHSPVAKAIANQYAAMPSLHFAWSLWCGIAIYRFARGGRLPGVLYPILTLFAIVVTGNHYFLDAAGGVLVLVAGASIMNAIDRRRTAAVVMPAVGTTAV